MSISIFCIYSIFAVHVFNTFISAQICTYLEPMHYHSYEKSTDIGSTLSWDVHIDAETNTRIDKAGAHLEVFRPLSSRLDTNFNSSKQRYCTVNPAVCKWDLEIYQRHACQETEPFASELSEKAITNHCRHCSSKESKHAFCQHCFETIEMGWSCDQ